MQIPPSYSIRNISVSPGLVLAPMSGVTTLAFRRLIKELNPGCVGLVMSEFISVEALTRNVKRSTDMMRSHPSERPYAVQIFGYDIERMSNAAKIVEASGADILDINCGCPAPKVVRKGGGCELMRQPQHLAKIIAAVKKSITIPLTMKIRSGWDSDSINAVEVAKIAESEGVEALAVHGRTRAQLYRGDADWGIVGEVARAIKIPVLGSGDVVDLNSARARLESGVSGLYIGRAAIVRPFVFSEITRGQTIPIKGDSLKIISILERYTELLMEEFNEKACIGKLKQLVSQFCRGVSWRKELLVALSFKEQRDILARIKDRFLNNQIMTTIQTPLERGHVSSEERCQ